MGTIDQSAEKVVIATIKLGAELLVERYNRLLDNPPQDVYGPLEPLGLWLAGKVVMTQVETHELSRKLGQSAEAVEQICKGATRSQAQWSWLWLHHQLNPVVTRPHFGMYGAATAVQISLQPRQPA